jgi:putative flippase GtrA
MDSPLVGASTPYALGAPVAFAAGAVNGHGLNRRWTFCAPDSTRAWLAYVWVRAVGVLAAGVLAWIVVHEAAAGRIGAHLVAVPPVTVLTFLANRRWIFADRH